MPLPLSLERAARRMEELIVATYVGHCLIDDEVTSINNKLKLPRKRPPSWPIKHKSWQKLSQN